MATEIARNHEEIASKINEEHTRAFGKAQDALNHARAAGELLIEAKSLLKHGEWGNWLAENVAFTERTAQSYMKLARNWDSLSKNETISDLGLVKTLSLISDVPKVGDYVEAWVPPLSPDRDYFTLPFEDGRCLVISPSLKHDGFYEVSTLNPLKPNAVDFWTVKPEGIEMILDWLLKAIKEKEKTLRWMACPGGSFSASEKAETTKLTLEEATCSLNNYRM
jgi:hypothetical protein